MSQELFHNMFIPITRYIVYLNFRVKNKTIHRRTRRIEKICTRKCRVKQRFDILNSVQNYLMKMILNGSPNQCIKRNSHLNLFLSISNLFIFSGPRGPSAPWWLVAASLLATMTSCSYSLQLGGYCDKRSYFPIACYILKVACCNKSQPKIKF